MTPNTDKVNMPLQYVPLSVEGLRFLFHNANMVVFFEFTAWTKLKLFLHEYVREYIQWQLLVKGKMVSVAIPTSL